MEENNVSNVVKIPFFDGVFGLVVFQYLAKDAKMGILRLKVFLLKVYNIPEIGLAGVEEDIDKIHLAGIGKVVVEKFLSRFGQAAEVLTLLADDFLNEMDLFLVLFLVLDIIVYKDISLIILRPVMSCYMSFVFLIDFFEAADEFIDVEERSPPKKSHYFEVKDDGIVLN